MVIGRGKDIIAVASDVLPFYGACSEVCFISDGDNLLISNNEISSLDSERSFEFEVLEGVYDEADPRNFSHMMLKEI